jgi:N-methylhydantoinase A
MDLVAFGGMGAVHATTQAAALGMRRALVPRGAAGLSALGLLTADHIIDDSRGYVVPWQQADVGHVRKLADELRAPALAELAAAGVPDDRVELNWSLLMVYPGQTFDVAIPVTDPTDIESAVAEFHRRNEEARLIEARVQEPILRGVRLTAVGQVEKVAPLDLEGSSADAPVIGRRNMYAGGVWTDSPVHSADDLLPGMVVTGAAVITSPFTTLVLRPGDRCEVTSEGDLLIDIAPEVSAG